MRLRLLILISTLMFSAINVSAQSFMYDANGELLHFEPSEEKPRFNGDSYKHFGEWCKEHQVYSRKALMLGLEGRVTVTFTITEDGKSVDVKVIRSVHKVLDKASVSLIKSSSGRWTPGTRQNKPARFSFTFPVIWELPEKE